MRRRNLLTVVCAMFVLVLSGTATTAFADAYMMQVSHTDAMEFMGKKQPAKTDTGEIWFAENTAYMTTDMGAAILNAEDGMIYMVNFDDKKYTEIPLAAAGEAIEEAGEMMEEMGEGSDPEKMAEMKKMMEENPEAAKMMGDMMEKMLGKKEDKSSGGMTATVTATDETKKIKDWDTRKYIVEMDIMMGTNTMEVWVTDDIEIDYERFHELSNAMLAAFPGFENIVAAMKKIKGVTVLSTSETKVMGTSVTSSTELVEYADKKAPDGLYDIPAGFKKVSLTELGMGR
jgi:hypothetical protein